jgi:hypothetical protein
MLELKAVVWMKGNPKYKAVNKYGRAENLKKDIYCR